MNRPDPTRKVPPDIPALFAALAEHKVTWLLAGSYVLTLYGAEFEPNDLDVVVQRDPQNLERLARCLDALDAVPFWGGDPKWDLGTVEDHLNWRPYPATITHLDQLFVTKHGMLDIPFALIPDYALLIAGSTKRHVGCFEIDICDPRSVLVALEGRNRQKDKERARIYAELRVRFGLPPVP